MTFDAKANFLSNKELSRKHRDMMVSPDFQLAAQAALQHFSDMETRKSTNAKASFHRIAASRDFLGVLLNLGEIITMPEKPQKQELNYKT